jgi:transcriptional regulator with XRE-family HTH domain
MTPEQIKKGRGALGLDQTQFAELLGLTRTTITAWEKGHKPPRAKNIAKMKELFNRQWVGLTKEEQQQLYNQWNQSMDGWGHFYRAIEAKLKEKNHEGED